MVCRVVAADEVVREVGPRPVILQSLEVPAFVPPPAKERKEVEVAGIAEATVRTTTANGRTFTIVRGAPSTKGELPEPAVQTTKNVVDAEPPTAERRERIAAAWREQRRHSIVFGATVYDEKVSRVHWQDPVSGEVYEAWCGFDLALLESIGEIAVDGKVRPLLVIPTRVDSAVLARLSGGRAAVDPVVGTIAPGEIRVIAGDAGNRGALESLRLLRTLIDNEKERLTVYQQQRREYQAAREAWRAAHPEEPRDHTLLLRPHRGSRYLGGEGGAK